MAQENFIEGNKVVVYYKASSNFPRGNIGIIKGSNSLFLFIFDEIHDRNISIALNSINKIEEFKEN